MKKTVKRIALLSALVLALFTLCGCTGIVDPPVVAEAQQVLQQSDYFVENGLTITEFDFIQIQTNRTTELQHIGFYYCAAECDEFILQEKVMIVWDFEPETQQWILNSIDHQEQDFQYFD